MNKEVSIFLDQLNHPFRQEIELLRNILLSVNDELIENIKWNGPNYVFNSQDRITMRIQPPKQVQLIFHCGAKKVDQPKERIIKDENGLLDWKENNRAVLSFKTIQEIKAKREDLLKIVKDWISV